MLSPGYPPRAIVVEIGAFRGRTTVFIAKVLKRLGLRQPVLSIDPFERVDPDPVNPQGSYSAYMENLRAASVDDVCAPLVAFSENAAPFVPDNVGLLVIDGCHHYEVVLRDLELYCPKVLPNGMVFIDDYTEQYAGVVRAVNEYFGSGGAFRIVHRSYFVIARREAADEGTLDSVPT